MVTILDEKCNGCGICAWVCPHGIIEMNGKLAHVAREEDCIECGACRLNCTPEAVHVTKGTGCLLVIIKEDILGIKEKKAACCG